MTCNNPVTALSCDGDVAVAALTCCTDTVDPPPDEEPVVEVTHRTVSDAVYRAYTPQFLQSPRFEPKSPGGSLVTHTGAVPPDGVDTDDGGFMSWNRYRQTTIDWL